MRPIRVLLAFLSLSTCASAQHMTGWRGNGTGLWPDAKPPLEWHRIPRGAMDGLREAADPPSGQEHGDAPLVVKGLVRHWLVAGPFSVVDSVKDFDRELHDVSSISPAPGAKLGTATWKPATVPAEDIMIFGNAELPWLDLAKALGHKRNQIAYAHAHLFSPRGGPVRVVAEHGNGLAVWVNGKEVYRAPQRAGGLGYYSAMGNHELLHLDQPSPSFNAHLKPGWNRVLLKISTSNIEGWTEMRACLRFMDPPDVRYDTKNIVWMTRLPGRSTSTPILVGDRLFLMAEPDEIVCVAKNDGRILWSAPVNYFEALTPEEKKKQPAYVQRVDPLIARLKAEPDHVKRVRLRAQIQKTLLDIDAKRFHVRANDHFEGHFAIVGFTMPSPVSDGKYVYVWIGTGVAACFDLDGRRQWITRVPADELAYGSSPVLADGVFVTSLAALYGFDAKTGKLLWQQRKVKDNLAALLGATVDGKPVIVCRAGHMVRPADGQLLFRQRDHGAADMAPPLVLGTRIYAPKNGVTSLNVWDLTRARAPAWEPARLRSIDMPGEVSRGPGGKWIDRWTAGSPLVWNGIAYQADFYQVLYALDLATGKMLYRQIMDMEGLMHYNAVPLTASPTLVGKHIFVSDNQGTTLVLQPGPTYKSIARNRIATQLERRWPIPAQETLAYAPPLAEGGRLYYRGEAHLYCIGREK
ncbi:MAG: hypothetical protein FJ271_04540 [Planctomycetes bacterium]|nr:hypothetical protein [Planctomycetota bacterium]